MSAADVLLFVVGIVGGVAGAQALGVHRASYSLRATRLDSLAMAVKGAEQATDALAADHEAIVRAGNKCTEGLRRHDRHLATIALKLGISLPDDDEGTPEA